jgi:hypothetical protein
MAGPEKQERQKIMKKRTLVEKLDRLEKEGAYFEAAYKIDGSIDFSEWKHFSSALTDKENELILRSVDKKYIDPDTCPCGHLHLNDLFWEDYYTEQEKDCND